MKLPLEKPIHVVADPDSKKNFQLAGADGLLIGESLRLEWALAIQDAVNTHDERERALQMCLAYFSECDGALRRELFRKVAAVLHSDNPTTEAKQG